MIRIVHIPVLFSKEGRTEREVEFSSSYVRDYFTASELTGNRVLHSRLGPLSIERLDEANVRDGDELILTPQIKFDPITWAAIIAAIVTFVSNLGVIGAIVLIAKVGMFAYAVYQAFNPKKPKHIGGGSDPFDDSPTYGWDGIRTMADVGIPVPVIYGESACGGNIISFYMTSQDDDSIMNIMLALSEGPVNSIAGLTVDTDYATKDQIDTMGDLLTINGSPISHYEDMELHVRLGTDDQTVIPGFDFTHEEFDLAASSIQLRFGLNGDEETQGYVYLTTNQDVDAINIHLSCPAGLFRNHVQTDNPEITSEPILYKVEYRVYNPDAPAAWTFYQFPRPWYVTSGVLDRGWVDGYGMIESPPTHSPVRRDVRIEFPASGRYEIRITRKWRDASEGPSNDDSYTSVLQVVSIDEIIYEGMTYPNTALIALRIRATEQLSGLVPNFAVVVQGKLAEDWTGGAPAYTSNPIKCIWDLMVNSRYGAGAFINASNLDAAYFATASAYCDTQVDIDGGTENRFSLDIVLDGVMTVPDALTRIGATFRCFPYFTAGLIRPFVEKPENPTQQFGMGNIINGTFSENWLPLRTRMNRVEVQYIDRDNGWIRETAEVTDTAAIDAGDPMRLNAVFLPGITRRSQAMRIGWYLLQSARLTRRAVSFRASIDAIVCQAGDVIAFNHNLPQWGQSGRVKSGTAGTVTLKDNVTLTAPPAGEANVIQIRHASTDEISVWEITSGLGTYVAGTAINITPPAGPPPNPAKYDVFAVGHTSTAIKPFRIAGMEINNDNEVDIIAAEYDVDVYEEDYTLLPDDPTQYSTLPDPRRRPLSVENLTATPIASYSAHALISFTVAAADEGYGYFDHAEIYLGIEDSNGNYGYQFRGTHKSGSFPVGGLIPNQSYRVRAVSVSKFGVRELDATAATVDFYFTPPGAPPNVRGLEIFGQGLDTLFNGKDVTFSWVPISLPTAGDYAGEGSGGAGQGVQNDWLDHYRVMIWDSIAGDGQIIRVFRTLEHSVIYTYEMNLYDHAAYGLPPDRQFGVSIRAVDKFNQYSPQHTSLNVLNASPELVIAYNDLFSTSALHWLWALEFIDYGTGMFSVSWVQSIEPDFDGYVVHRQVDAADPAVFSKSAFTNPATGATQFQPDDRRLIVPGLYANQVYLTGPNTSFQDSIPASGKTKSYTLAAYDKFGRTQLNYDMHFVVDEFFDGTRDPVTGLWIGVTAYKW